MGCYVWYSDEGTGRGPSPPRPIIAVPNVTAHPSTASVPITILLYNDPLLCGFNVPIKGLRYGVFRSRKNCKQLLYLVQAQVLLDAIQELTTIKYSQVLISVFLKKHTLILR